MFNEMGILSAGSCSHAEWYRAPYLVEKVGSVVQACLSFWVSSALTQHSERPVHSSPSFASF